MAAVYREYLDQINPITLQQKDIYVEMLNIWDKDLETLTHTKCTRLFKTLITLVKYSSMLSVSDATTVADCLNAMYPIIDGKYLGIFCNPIQIGMLLTLSTEINSIMKRAGVDNQYKECIPIVAYQC